MRLKRFMDGKLDLGPAPTVSLLEMMMGLQASSTNCWDFIGGHISTGVGIRGQQKRFLSGGCDIPSR